MSSSFHESYRQGEIQLPSDRSTGLVFAAVAVIVAALWRKDPTVPWVALGVAAILSIVSLAVPIALRPLNWIWFRIGLLLHRVMNPLIMLAMFALVFVPAGWIMRIWYDPLRSRRAAPGSSYWINRQKNDGSMANQF
jgi:hypothetical protein